MRAKAALLLLGVAVLPARAAEPLVVQLSDQQQYFSVLGGYFGADKDRGGTKRGITGSGIYGYRFTPHWGVEANLMGTTIETGGDKGTDFYQEGGTIDAVYGFKDRSESWTPFVLLGIGGVFNDVIPNSRDKASLIGNAGVGVVSSPLTSLGIKLRGEGRYQYDSYRSGFQDYRLLAGIELPFGKRSVELAALAPPVVEIREVVVPAPFIDSDKDTIEDSRDKCPNTPEGLRVDADGCVISGQSLELRGVTFALNKAELQLNAQTVLDYVAKGMQGQPGMVVEIAGHTDSVGSNAYNLKLSQRRAESVSTYLVGKGIEPSRLTAKGYGETELLVKPETTPTDYERNRRVVFRVLGN